MVYIKTSKLSITHEDQELDGLKFQILASKDNTDYVQVEGADDKVLAWKTRVEGADSTIDEVNAIIACLPKPEEELLKERISALEVGLATVIGV